MRCFIPFLQHSTHIYTASIELGTLFLMSTPVKSLSAASGKDKTLDTETASVKTQDEFFQTTIDSPTSSVFAKANKDPSQSLTEVDSSIGYFN